MYAVINSGGKQERVEEGSVVEVELLAKTVGQEVSFTPLLVVDGDRVVSASEALSALNVLGVVVSETKGPKIIGFKYHAKANVRKRWGHRQRYSAVRITQITA